MIRESIKIIINGLVNSIPKIFGLLHKLFFDICGRLNIIKGTYLEFINNLFYI